MNMSLKARLYWLTVVGTGLYIIASGAVTWNLPQENLLKLAFYLIAAIVASRLKIKLPGVLGTLSMNYLFIVVSLLELQLESAILIGVLSVIAQILIRARSKPTWEQVVFSAAAITVPIVGANWVLERHFIADVDPTRCLALVSASMVYFLLNTWLVA